MIAKLKLNLRIITGALAILLAPRQLLLMIPLSLLNAFVTAQVLWAYGFLEIFWIRSPIMTLSSFLVVGLTFLVLPLNEQEKQRLQELGEAKRQADERIHHHL